MALNTFLLYLAAWTLVALSPGPAVFFTMSQAARHGNHGAIAGTAGILLGHFVCFAFVAFGLAAVLAQMSGAMTVIRIVGALYLMYLGVRMILSKTRAVADVTAAAPEPPASHSIVLQGLLVQLTNPKNLMFVLAFLPQFISAERPLLPQLAIMLTVTVVIDAAFLMGYAQIATRGVRAIKGSRVITWLERAFGAALIFFGAKLLTSQK
ncbi:MAG TPA: LysE family translocator [Steroidobacteraceae bacterium]|nr:LysE family translocator [Steroidobacteraceae bacterium]